MPRAKPAREGRRHGEKPGGIARDNDSADIEKPKTLLLNEGGKHGAAGGVESHPQAKVAKDKAPTVW
jgi:hypothetical protein